MRRFSKLMALKSQPLLLSLAIISPTCFLAILLMLAIYNPSALSYLQASLPQASLFIALAIVITLALICLLYMIHRYWRGQMSFTHLNHLHVPIVTTTRQGDILFANKAFDALFPEAQSHIRQLFPYLMSAPARASCEALLTMTWGKSNGSNRFVFADEHQSAKTFDVYFRRNKHSIYWTFVKDTNHYPSEGQNPFQRGLDFIYLFNTTPSANVILDEDGVIQGMNDTFKSEFLKDSKIVNGNKFIDLLAPLCAKEMSYDIISQLKTKEKGAALDLELSWGDNVIAYISPLAFHYDSQDYRGYYLQIFDNSEQHNIQLRLAHSHKLQALGQLAGGIAHDFNNLLTAMIGFCDLLLMRLSPGDQSFTDIMQIKQNANRATNLVCQLLAFSRQQTLQPTVLDVSEVLSDLSILLQRLIGSSIILRISHDSAVDFIRVDRSQFEQVIVNIVVNAKDAIYAGGDMNRDGTITITTSLQHFHEPTLIDHETIPAGSYIQIEVQDNGQGISRKNLERIFDPFFTTKALGEGTGLGLATAYGTVKQTGGHVSVESTVSVGTKFTILLPQYIKEKTEKNSDGSETQGAQNTLPQNVYRDLTGKGSILLAEDEDAVRLFICRALSDKGYTVDQACNGQEALDMLQKRFDDGLGAPDLLITDVVMPKMDGPTLVKEAERLFPHMKVMYISGYAEDAFRDIVNLEEKIRFLAKPFSLKVLATRVKETMESA